MSAVGREGVRMDLEEKLQITFECQSGYGERACWSPMGKSFFDFWQ